MFLFIFCLKLNYFIIDELLRNDFCKYDDFYVKGNIYNGFEIYLFFIWSCKIF